MKTLYRMTAMTLIPVFFVSLSFFVLLLEMVDLFSNLWRYLNQDVSLANILLIQTLYLPKCVSYSIPIALLFSIAYSLGEFYSKNELIAVFGAGVSLYRFIVPMLALGFFLSFAGFFFEESLVIETYKDKNSLVNTVLNANTTFSNSNITILGDDARFVYHAEYYNDQNKTLSNLIAVKRDKEGNFVERIDAESAVWKNTAWELSRVRIFTLREGVIEEKEEQTLSDPEIDVPPDSFRRITRKIEEMSAIDARTWIETLKRAGLPYREALTEYYKKFSFALAPLIVAFLSSALGGWFRKNILLMSLLSSLVLSVIYYVSQMLLVLLAKLGYVAPIMGAWAAFFIFMAAGFLLMRTART